MSHLVAVLTHVKQVKAMVGKAGGQMKVCPKECIFKIFSLATKENQINEWMILDKTVPTATAMLHLSAPISINTVHPYLLFSGLCVML